MAIDAQPPGFSSRFGWMASTFSGSMIDPAASFTVRRFQLEGFPWWTAPMGGCGSLPAPRTIARGGDMLLCAVDVCAGLAPVGSARPAGQVPTFRITRDGMMPLHEPDATSPP
jgi:hypothetical protein